MSQQLTEEQRKVLVKVEVLLRLADGTTSESEAASAATKAQELLTAYALDASAVGSGDDGKRSEEKLEGGFYEYERDLWAWVADVCYCVHWCGAKWVKRSEAEQRVARVAAYRDPWRRKNRLQMYHTVIGRKVSVSTATNMVNYLLAAVERLTREFVAEGLRPSDEGAVVGLGAALRSRRAVSFREGCVRTIIDKLIEKRNVQLSEEREAERQAAAKEAEAASKGLSSSTQMTVAQLRQSERDANMDFLYGEGWSAKQRAARAAQDALTAWAQANPEEAAKQEAERRAEVKKTSARRGRQSYGRAEKEKEKDWAAFSAGRERGKAVGLDAQADGASAPRLGGAR